MMNLLWIRSVGILLLVMTAFNVDGQLKEPFLEQKIPGQWYFPVQFLFESNGQGYVVERHGLVWRVDEEGRKVGDPLIDIVEEVAPAGDHGLMSMALHPAFRSNGYIYLLYVVDRHHLMHYGTPQYDPNVTITEQATIARVTRYTVDPASGFTRLLDGSRKVLIGDRPDNGFPILMGSHGAGSLVFGTDGTLLVSCGDSGSYIEPDFGSTEDTYFEQALEDGIITPRTNVGSYRAQLVDCLNGKILRIDALTGAGLPSNPFYDPADPFRPASRVWALGFRQPYRFIVKPGTGSHNPDDGDPGVLFVGDVGWGLWEELNIVTEGGQNFGWPLYEGFVWHWQYFPTDVINPDAANPLLADSCDQPYFYFKDLCKQPLRDQKTEFVNPCNPDMFVPDSIPTFVLRLPAIAWSNEKYNLPTRAVIHAWDEEGEVSSVDIESAPVTGINFHGSSSIPGFFYQGEALPEEYRGKLFICDFTGWIRVMDFDDAYRVVEVDTIHTDIRWIVGIAEHPVTGEIFYSDHRHNACRITYGGNAAPRADFSASALWGPSPLEIMFDGTLSSDANNDALAYAWDFGNGQTSTADKPVVIFDSADNKPQRFDVILEVTDVHGASASMSKVVSINNTPPDVRITSIEDSTLYSMSGVSFLPLQAQVNDAEHTDDELAYQWLVFFHHNDHYHPEFPIEEKESRVRINPAGCGEEIYFYRVRLEVTDGAGLIGYDEVYLYPYCGPDVVQFIDLEGTVDEEYIELTWQVSDADMVEKYVVERENDLLQFVPVGETTPGVLTFTDPDPIHGRNTYRIVGIDGAGHYTFSDVLKLQFPPDPDFRVSPNPAGDFLNVVMSSTNARNIAFELYSPSGTLVLQETWFHDIPELRLSEQVALAGLPQGIYYYVVDDGGTKYRGSVIKVDR